MKSLRHLLPVIALTLLSARATTDPATVWRAADDARVAAMISADPVKLAATISDELLYVHSSGSSDTKASLIQAVTTGRLAYHAITYEKREFREVVPGLVLMTGRGRFALGKAAPFNELHLSFLAVYRLEKGVWRFLAWQSCKLPEPAAPAKP